jgi:adenine-specific DNA-methyltransferase
MKKIELYKKIQNADPSYLKKLNITNEEWDFIKSKLINDKLGLTINFQEIDEKISKNYFGFEEIKNLNINAKDKNNHLIIEGENYHALKALSVANIKVDIIYIDPPYNTGKEFIYNDDFSTKKSVGKDDPHKHSK